MAPNVYENWNDISGHCAIKSRKSEDRSLKINAETSTPLTDSGDNLPSSDFGLPTLSCRWLFINIFNPNYLIAPYLLKKTFVKGCYRRYSGDCECNFAQLMKATLNQFTLIVPVNGRQREFNFRQRSNELYNGNTADERGERHYFDVIVENGDWKFKDQLLPAWLKQHEDAIIKGLKRYLSVE